MGRKSIVYIGVSVTMVSGIYRGSWNVSPAGQRRTAVILSSHPELGQLFLFYI